MLHVRLISLFGKQWEKILMVNHLMGKGLDDGEVMLFVQIEDVD